MNKEAATMSAHIIEPVSLRDVDPEACAVLDALRKAHTELLVSFAFMVAQPKALAAFSAFQQATMNDPCLKERHRELAYLKTAMLADCKLCIANHTTAAKSVGLAMRRSAPWTIFPIVTS
jgi:AhpD family alkylhydroperoxidase